MSIRVTRSTVAIVVVLGPGESFCIPFDDVTFTAVSKQLLVGSREMNVAITASPLSFRWEAVTCACAAAVHPTVINATNVAVRNDESIWPSLRS
jgi:hypothetical protein